MAQKYQVISGVELNKMRESLGATFLFQDSKLLCRVYQLSNGKVIAYPAVGSKGILAENKLDMLESLQNGFPISSDNPNPFENDKEKLKYFESNISYYLDKLEKDVGIKIGVDGQLSNAEMLAIDQLIRSYGFEKFYNDHFIPFGIFVGEILRNRFQLEWGLRTEYGYNPYYYPFLKGGDHIEIDPWYNLAHMFLKKKRYSLKEHLDLLEVFTRDFRVK